MACRSYGNNLDSLRHRRLNHRCLFDLSLLKGLEQAYGETTMNVLNGLIAVGMIAVAVVMAILTEGLLLPLSLPMLVYSLKLLGVNLQ